MNKTPLRKQTLFLIEALILSPLQFYQIFILKNEKVSTKLM